MLKVFSYGGGVQSTAALVLAAQGRIDYHTFLFCNVGADSENPGTLTYVEEVAKPFAARHRLDLIELERIKRDHSVETVYGRLTRPGSRSIGIPVHMSSGAPGRRACTVDFKIRVIDRWLIAHGARSSGAIIGLGISLDEFERVKPNMDPKTMAWKTLHHPLIFDLSPPLDRAGCLEIIRCAGLPLPPKSSCWFCPFHSRRAWQALRDEQPALFQKAVELEQLVNERRTLLGRDRVFFSARLRPLEKATTDYTQRSLFADDSGVEGQPCDSGYCFL